MGSGALGFTLAAVPFLATPGTRASVVLFLALSLWLFLADATWTLLRRMARGERPHHAHREHLYQRLVSTGWGHGRVAGGIGVVAAALTAAALAASRSFLPAAQWAPVLLAAIVFSGEITLVTLRERRRFWGDAQPGHL